MMTTRSNFNPTILVSTPARQEPDVLAGSVLASLTRPLYYKLSWGPLRSVILGALTLGILPVVLIPRWMRNIVAQHEQQLWHLAEWLRVQTADPDTAELQKSAEQIRYSPLIAMLTYAAVLVAVGAVLAHFIDRSFSLRELYRFAFHVSTSAASITFAVAISIAALLDIAHQVYHQQHIERYLQRFNQVIQRQDLRPIPEPPLQLGLRPTWIIAALFMVMIGAPWGFMVLLAAGAHRRYTISTSVMTRAALADRLRALLAQRRPMMRLPKPITVVRACIRPNCRAPLSEEANFCPRCGTAAVRKMDVVA
jgi:hypothetical protein